MRNLKVRHAGVEGGVVIVDGGLEVSNRHRFFGLVYIEVVNVWRGQSQSEKTSTVSTVNCPRVQREEVYARVACRR